MQTNKIVYDTIPSIALLTHKQIHNVNGLYNTLIEKH